MSLTIVGLSFLGSSIGLALKASLPELDVVGHDSEPERAALAVKRKAVDRSHWNLPAACEHSDIIILDVAQEQLVPTLQVLADCLVANTLVIDLSPAKREAQESAHRLLPSSIRYIGAYIVPQTSGQGAAPSAELLKDAMFYLAVLPETQESAIHTTAGIADVLGARACFTSPDELDSLIAAGSQLPALAALALMLTWQESGGWKDRQHALDASIGWIKQVLEGLPDAQTAGLWQNRDILTVWLDNALEKMQSIRAAMQAADPLMLNEMINRVHRQAPQPETSHQEAEDNEDALGIRQLLLGSAGRVKKHKS